MKILITGGCGFIGANLAHYFLDMEGSHIILYDNLMRSGVTRNLKWLRSKPHKGKLEMVRGDIRDTEKLEDTVKDSDAIFHTAAQVAVTTSVKKPFLDFEINGLGTLNVLEAARRSSVDPVFIYTSTNKVYGDLSYIELEEKPTRYVYKDLKYGVDESTPIDPHTPYGVSKYIGDAYTIDYARTYGLKSIVFRQSCIYGTHQHGCVDQGWLVLLAAKALIEGEVTIYGDGKQVRDVLYIDDLVKLFERAVTLANKLKGQVYNIGGGSDNTYSILEYVELLRRLTNKNVKATFEPWRPSDQKVYISDIRKTAHDFDWKPETNKEEGVKRMLSWIKKNISLFL